MLNNPPEPYVGQVVQYLYAQGHPQTFAAIVTEVITPSDFSHVSVEVFPPPLHSSFLLHDRQAIPHMDSNGPQPVYPCWREA